MKVLDLMTVAACLAAPLAARAQAEGAEAHHHHHHHAKPPEGDAVKDAAVKVTLRDEALLDQEGRSLRFKQDALGDGLVVMTVMYTSCTTVCPVTTALLSQVQGVLGDRVGRDVRLISLTVDPATDTPERLKAYAAKVGAKPGWLWLTGHKPAVSAVLEGLDAWTADFTRHPSMVLVGDPAADRWQRFYGFPSPARVVAAVDQMQAARAAAPGKE